MRTSASGLATSGDTGDNEAGAEAILGALDEAEAIAGEFGQLNDRRTIGGRIEALAEAVARLDDASYVTAHLRPAFGTSLVVPLSTAPAMLGMLAAAA